MGRSKDGEIFDREEGAKNGFRQPLVLLPNPTLFMPLETGILLFNHTLQRSYLGGVKEKLTEASSAGLESRQRADTSARDSRGGHRRGPSQAHAITRAEAALVQPGRLWKDGARVCGSGIAVHSIFIDAGLIDVKTCPPTLRPGSSHLFVLQRNTFTPPTPPRGTREIRVHHARVAPR